MYKKTGSLALAVLLLAVLLIPTAAAQTEASEVEISVLYGGHYDVTTADTLVLRSGWLACSRGLVRAFFPAGNYQVILNGGPDPLLAPDDVRALWGPIEPGYLDGCKNPDKAAFANWRYDWGQLEAGEYELYTELWTDHPIPDGLDWDGDGKPDPVLWYYESTVTISVTD